MRDIETIVAKYVASWEQPDAGLRREVIAELWAEDAVYRNPIAEFHGRSGIEDAVTEAYDMFVTKGYVFRVAKVDSNHDVVRYTWEMTQVGDTEPEAVGTQVVSLDADGRMLCDHQFVDKAPEAMLELLGMADNSA